MLTRYATLAIAALSVSLVLSGCEEAAPPEKEVIRPVRAAQVVDSESLGDRWFSGQAKAAQEGDLAFKVPGELMDLPVNVGDRVAEGQMLARLDPDPYTASADSARASVEKAKATLQAALLEFERTEILYEKGHVAKARLDNVTAIVQRDQADLASAEASLRRADLDLGYTTMTAPFDGEIVQKYVENFENIRASQAVLRIVDSSSIEMVIDIPENLISLAGKVAETITVFDAFPDRVIPGTIKEIGTEASATTRTYPVTIRMEQPDDIKILPGMAGKVTASAVAADSELQSRIQIPVSATFTEAESGGTYVWVIDETLKTVSKRAVRTGDLTNTGVEVTDGLTAGEWIATAGVHYLTEGQQVRILAE